MLKLIWYYIILVKWYMLKKERDRWYPGQKPTDYYFSFYTPDGYYLNYTHDIIDDKIKYIT